MYRLGARSWSYGCFYDAKGGHVMILCLGYCKAGLELEAFLRDFVHSIDQVTWEMEFI
jgi:hypothetical protein